MGMNANKNTIKRDVKFSVVVWKNMAVKKIALNDNKIIRVAAIIGITCKKRLRQLGDESTDSSTATIYMY